jgi:cytochrome b pre-mRNA-processing protein 3
MVDFEMMSLARLFRRRSVENAADHLYAAAVRQARQPEFYAALGVADSLDGRFDLLALHVFLLLHRLGRGERAARAVSQAVFDLMFADMDRSLRELGVSDVAVGGRVKAMARAFYGRVAAYGAGLTDSPALADALARNLYRGVPVDGAHLAAMVAYVERQAAALAAQDLAELEEGRVRLDAPISL